ncbi:uncharacterized protein [Nicotiana sylvestris]|uniref:Uncharacterized protein LOC104213385 n=1 Tax=Nicotiana sylvestris TaxID=4096 RepID=A0A1U7VFS1_NICSY|nr:PREDICTED: uncharacterized protein LOC104213385 [Nicotiana sylvestris]
MADVEEGEAAITEAQLEKLKKWERIRNSQSLSDPPPATRSLVAIRDFSIHKIAGEFAVFPPVNHENLYISTNFVGKTHSQSSSPPFPSSPSLSSSSSSSFSPSNRDNDDSSYSFTASDANAVDPPKSVPGSPRPPARVDGYGGKWWNLGLQVLFSRVNGIAMFRWFFTSARRAVTSMLSPYGVAAMFVLFAYFRLRRRLVTRQSGEQLRRTITEKDERINQLLSQIAEMNQVLVAMHKGNLSKN